MRLKVLQAADAGERGMGTVAVLKHLLTDGEGLGASRAPTLTCLTGLEVGRTFALAEAKTDIGRGTEVDLRLRDRSVSRTHARIVRQGSTFAVRDLGSPNGVFVNGHRVRRSARLFDGDVIEVGQTILRFQAAVEEPPPTPEPSASLAEACAPARDSAVPTRVGQEPSPRPSPGGRGGGLLRSGQEWWLIALGAATALAGVLVTYALVS
jgi:hypothetical protein